MMFYCEECRVKKEWPTSFSSSYGGCELCGSIGVCYDRPSRSLSPIEKCIRCGGNHSLSKCPWSAAKGDAND